MAGNSDGGNKENIHCPSIILKAIPNHCQRIPFAQLNTNENYTDKAIVGKITHLHPIGKRATGYIRKLLVVDALSEEQDVKQLTVFLLDEFAQDSTSAELEGYIIITNFILENSTHHKDNELPFQVLVKKDESQVVFLRRIPPSETKEENVKKPKKSKNQTSDNNTSDKQVVLANQYEYSNLGELEETDDKMKFNVYGVVDKCDLKVIQGNRTQILDLFLTDETAAAFCCSIFAPRDETFPDVYPGDIIRIHRMQVSNFRSKLKGKCISPKFLLVFNKNNNGAKPRSVAKSFTFTPEDSERVRTLFEWYDKKSEPKLICELNKGDYANIVCQIIGVYCAKRTDTVVLKIWDGTQTNHVESSHWGLKEEKLDEKLFTIAKNYYVILSVYGKYAASAGELKPGQFIEVQDVHLYSPKTNPDNCKLCLHTGTKEGRGIQVLNNDDERIKKLKERLERIISDVQEFGNQTDDLLSQNNSIFLNCDISAFGSQKPTNNEEVADVPALNEPCSSKDDNIQIVSSQNVDVQTLNEPFSSKDENIPAMPSQNMDVQAVDGPCGSKDDNIPILSSQNVVISVVDAAIKPGQATQEFGEGIQKESEAMDVVEESEPDPLLNKTPVEYRMFLHNPSSQTNSGIFPFSSDTEEEWWNAVSTVSITDNHSSVKPSSLAEVAHHDVPYQFRVLCVVLSYKPVVSTLNQLIHLCCPKCLYMTEDAMPSIDPFQERDGLFYYYCPECSSKEVNTLDRPVLEYTYLISFDIHDFTGPSSLEVYLWKENAVEFFKGISPEQALRDSVAAESIFQMLWNICPNCKPLNLRNTGEIDYTTYPILDCCILSYSTAARTCYQMFDTKII